MMTYEEIERVIDERGGLLVLVQEFGNEPATKTTIAKIEAMVNSRIAWLYENGEIDRPIVARVFMEAGALEFRIRPKAIDVEYFTRVTGRPPMHDDLERCNCPTAGAAGHAMCGWCDEHWSPAFICGCMRI